MSQLFANTRLVTNDLLAKLCCRPSYAPVDYENVLVTLGLPSVTIIL